MIEIEGKIVSTDLLTEKFACDLSQCKGACCIEGDAGAPLEIEEVDILEEEYENYKPYMTAEGIKAVEEQGFMVVDSDGDYTTPLINGGECAFTCYDENGVALCAIDKAYREGKCGFQKPISCHLYPIRVLKFKNGGEGLNYHRWYICKSACENGCKLGIPVYKGLREPIVRKWGEEFYKALEVAEQLLKTENGKRKTENGKLMKKIQLLILALCGAATAVANPLDSLTIKPIEKLQSAIVVDTLPTADKHLSIVLFNDNSWRYIRTAEIQPDSTAFTRCWSTEKISPYRDSVALSQIPNTVPIRLVDSLRSYRYPIKGRITSRYGLRRRVNHNGIDIALKVGDTICSAFDGRVRFSKATDTGYGTLVIIRHDNGIETYHGHLSKRLVEAGERVVAGQPIALGGNSGRSTGPHLHFECRYMGQSFDPERLIDFKTGDLRREELLLKRSYFSIYSNYEQDWNGEKVLADADKKEAALSAERRYYKVRSGDYLGKIAARNHTTVSAICRLNGIKANAILPIGKVLRVK